MVAPVKLLLKLQLRIYIEIDALKIMINPLRRQHLALSLKLLVPLLPKGIGRAVNDIVIHGIQYRLHLYIRRKVPKFLIFILVRRKHMPEDAVKHDMKVQPAKLLGTLYKKMEHEARIIMYSPCIRPHPLGIKIQCIPQAVQRPPHKSHGEIQLGP